MLDIILITFFVICIFFVVHTYIIFPMLMKLLAKTPQNFGGEVPKLKVAILMAVYNEESVIRQKMMSMLETNYPQGLLEIWVGSDCSTDNTDLIMNELAAKYPNVHFKRFNERTGKPQIINDLQTKTQADILILTDADTMFYRNTIEEMVKPFMNPQNGGVQAYFISTAPESNVSEQEIAYNNREIVIKQGESRLGSVIGAYGACYAIRNELYIPVPKNFIVDDFFLFMKVLEKGFSTVLNDEAKCTMEISGNSEIEFRRKVRIGSGNFQNFFYFKSFWNPFRITNWVYWSHKALRWFTPIFLALILLLNICLYNTHVAFKYILFFQFFFYGSSLFDLLLERLGITIKGIRFMRHFVLMNFALLLGFFKFLSGVQKSSWDTKNEIIHNHQ